MKCAAREIPLHPHINIKGRHQKEKKERKSRQINKKRTKETTAHEDEFVVFTNAPESIRPSVTPQFVESDCGYEGRVALTASDHSLFPG
jgi:hypothetical protein